MAANPGGSLEESREAREEFLDVSLAHSSRATRPKPGIVWDRRSWGIA